MNDFLKLAYDLLAKVVYYFASCFSAFFGGLVKLLFTGWADYATIFAAYFPNLKFPYKILALLLAAAMVAIPVIVVVLIVKRLILRAQLKAIDDDNTVLYKEIGRLNNQVLELNEEKKKILNMKVSGYTGPINALETIPASTDGEVTYATTPSTVASSVIVDPLADPISVGAGTGTVATGIVGNITGANIGEDALSAATAAAVSAVTAARQQNEEQERNSVNRFPKLSMVDVKYSSYEYPEFDNDITLEQFVENYRLFAASQLKLYYTPEIIRRFVSGMAASRLLILEGISGTGKTSLPYSFSRYLNNPATIVSVQPSFRERTELLGYFNEFSKRFNETEFLRAVYESGYREDPSLIVLDEMNLARIEYYFAEILSVLELPNEDEWMLDLVPTSWPGDPVRLDGGKIKVPTTVWFVGTANNDDSTFTITDKVYDRAISIEINERADPFVCEKQPYCNISCNHLEQLFQKARADYPISEDTLSKMSKLDIYLQTRFKLAFGNRVSKQMHDFIPVYIACGGTELGGLDYIVSRKVLKKFESLNVAFVRDEMSALIDYIERTFGSDYMPDSRSYLDTIKNLY